MSVPRGGGLPLLVGVTGHRALPAADVPALERAVAAVLSGLERKRRGRPILVVSPCAEGADRLVARVGLARGMRLLVLMPMPRRLYERDFDAGSRAEFRRLVRASDFALEMPLLPGATPRSVSAPASVDRKLQYLRMGIFLAGHADVLIALWNGRRSKELGGTGQIVEFRRTGRLELPPGERSRLLGGRPSPSGARFVPGPVHHVLAPNGAGDVLVRAVGTRRLVAGRHR
jgi:hypothetical protein